MQYFTQDNTTGFTNEYMALMNKSVNALLGGSTDEDDIKNACDKVSNIFDFNARGLLTRCQAAIVVGCFSVDMTDNASVDFSNRVMGDGTVEFTAHTYAKNEDGDEVLLTAHYYQTEQDVKEYDLDELDWRVAGYSIT